MDNDTLFQECYISNSAVVGYGYCVDRGDTIATSVLDRLTLGRKRKND